MKPVTQIFFFASLWLILCGCPSPGNRKDDMAELKKNRYDFKKLVKKNYRGIYFDCPLALENSFVTDHLYKKDGLSLSNRDIGIFLSVEKFDSTEADAAMFYFEEEIPRLTAIHEMYMEERRKSLKYLENSIKTDLPEGVKLPGSLEVIYGRQDDYEQDLKYIIATVEKDNSWYVFQFVVGQDLSGYLFDDFKDLLKSVR